MGDKETRRTSNSGLAFAAAFVVLVVGLFLALGGAAYAQQTPAGDEYEENEAANVFTPPTAGGADEGIVAETLPFSGLSLLGTVVLGAALVTIGVLLRRREQKT
jgi:hypothetical protein